MPPMRREALCADSSSSILRGLLIGTLLCLLHSARIFAQQDVPSFEFDVLPVLTKHGCNSGACHGAVAGRGQFFLSLWGADPKSDYEQIVNAFQSRRVRYQDPQESLILAKPIGQISHEGGVLFDSDSDTANTLSTWIHAGAPYGKPLQIDQYSIEVQELESSGPKPKWSLKAFAKIHGSENRIDVSQQTAWEFDPNGSIRWEQHLPSVIRLERPGRHLIVARYAGQVRSTVLIAPYPSESTPKQVPSSQPSTNFVDDEIQRLLQKANVQAAPSIGHLEWLRRGSLDLVGRLPTIQEIQLFEGMDSEVRKSQMLDRWIASEDFDRYWTFQMARWLGLRPVSNEPEATRAFEDFLVDRISKKSSWRQIARELLLSTGDSHKIGQANFARLAVDARAHAELVSRVFLGSRMQCANCHNHPLDRWKQDDYHGLSAILAGIDRGRTVSYVGGAQVTNLRTKEPAIPKLPGGEYLEVQSDSDASERNLERLGHWIFDQTNPKFARVVANRLWALMMGRGLVDPVDDFRDTNPASHPELLDRLAEVLIESDYQPSSVLRAIVLSDTYARQAPDSASAGIDPSFFAVHIRKPLAPEVLYDALHDALGVRKELRATRWLDPTTPSESLDILGRCARGSGCEPLSNSGSNSASLSQQLHWINGPLVNQAIESQECFLEQEISRGISDEDLLKLGYLRIQGKHASDQEVRFWSDQIPKSPDQRLAWFEDWTWSMLSSNAFLSN